MSVRVCARVRGVKASVMLRGPKAGGYARSGDHVMQFESFTLRTAVATMRFQLLSFTVVYCNV